MIYESDSMDPVGGEEQRLADANGEFEEQTDRAGLGKKAEETTGQGEYRNTETEDATPGELSARQSPENDQDDKEMNVAAVRRAKTSAKTAFMKARRALLSAIANNFTPAEINGWTAQLDDEITVALEIMESLATVLELQDNNQAAEKVSEELEKIEEEYSSAQNRAAEYYEEVRLRERRHTTYRSELRHREHYVVEQPTSFKEEAREQFHNEEPVQKSIDLEKKHFNVKLQQSTQLSPFKTRCTRFTTLSRPWWRLTMSSHVHERSGQRALALPAFRRRALQKQAASLRHPLITQLSQPQPGARNPLDIWADLRQQLKRVMILIFDVDKRVNCTWKAAFMDCIDKAPATAEYKQLRHSTCAEMHSKRSKASATRQLRMKQPRRGLLASTAESVDESPRTWRPYNKWKQCACGKQQTSTNLPTWLKSPLPISKTLVRQLSSGTLLSTGSCSRSSLSHSWPSISGGFLSKASQTQ